MIRDSILKISALVTKPNPAWTLKLLIDRYYELYQEITGLSSLTA